MALNLLSEEPLTENAALFEDDETQGHDQGDIIWSEPEEVSTDRWRVTFSGDNTAGITIEDTDTDVTSQGKPTPGQVIIWLFNKLKEVLCEECV